MNALQVVPLILGSAVAIFATVVSIPVLCAFVLSGRASRREERRPLHTHTCSQCGRIQRWGHEFDQFSPCRACQSARGAKLEIDLEQFADAAAIRAHLDGADVLHLNVN